MGANDYSNRYRQDDQATYDDVTNQLIGGVRDLKLRLDFGEHHDAYLRNDQGFTNLSDFIETRRFEPSTKGP